MKHRPEDILALAEKTTKSLATGAWPAFLRTAAWNFKYDFPSQLLIFAQKPDATACAPYDFWTSKQFQRQPRRGTAIALLAENGPNPSLRYVFDISDTVVRKGAHMPVNPVWEVTPENEPAVRAALAKAFLPYEQQTKLHLTSHASDFYRSVAFCIVRNHYEGFFNDLMQIQGSCALKGMSEIETERTFRNLLTESISAVLQFRCGLLPEINEETLSLAKLFNSPQAISVLGRTVQAMAKEGLLEVSHAVHARNAPTIQPESREEAPVTNCLAIGEEDITRAITVGPPLEGGKFRLQLAAEDPDLTSEQLADRLRTEYGTGCRAFMLTSGIHGTLSWGAQGLKIARNGFSECSDLTLGWKTASERLKTLVRANLYLEEREKSHMLAWLDDQNALSERQKTGAELSALLTMLVPTREDLPAHLEQVRAYVYDNSDTARRALTDVLQRLNDLDRTRAAPDARTLLRKLTDALSMPKEKQRPAVTIADSPEPSSREGASRLNDEGTCGNVKNESLYINDVVYNSEINCTPASLKSFPFADKNTKKTGSQPASTRSKPASESLRTNSEHPNEPLFDHPELRRKELHRLDRRDKVALTDLLYHYTTYRYTFQSHTPSLCEHDARHREEQLATLDEMLVSPSVEENLENLRKAKSILTRWFLPFDGIRPEILAEQETLIEAAEQVLAGPPEQAEAPAHDYKYNYNYTHTEPIGAVEIDDNSVETLWTYETAESSPLSGKIQGAQFRAAAQAAAASELHAVINPELQISP